jgi:hypothetical protein
MSNRPSFPIPDDTRAEWEAADAILDKRDDQLAAIWESCTLKGHEAVKGVMDYISILEGQNRRLNRRIDMIETQIRFLDRMEFLTNAYKQNLISSEDFATQNNGDKYGKTT